MGLDVGPDDSWPFLEGIVFNLVIEVSDVTDDGVVFHLGHVAGFDDVLVTGGGNEDVHLIDDVIDGNDFVAFHASLKGADGVNFSDVDSGTGSAHGLTASFSDITITEDEDLLTGDHDIGGSVDTIDEGVLASVNVVELGLGN